jgi:plasmid stabilization system protein ParE
VARGLIWTEPAWRDLEQSADYIAQDSPAYAEAFVHRMRRAAESLQDMPRLGRVVPELGHESTRELLVDNYRLIYEVRADALYIVRLIHGARDLARLLEGG